MAGSVATLRFDTERMAAAAPEGFALATEIAEWLVQRGVPFREAHEVSGRASGPPRRAGSSCGTSPTRSSPASRPSSTAEVRDRLSAEAAVAARSRFGGTAPVRVAEQLADLRATHRHLGGLGR